MSSPYEQTSDAPRQEWALASYLSAIRAHWLVVALVTLAAVMASIAFLTLRSPNYEATAEILVEPLPQSEDFLLGLPLVRDSGDPVRTVQTAATLVDSQAAADRAAEQLGRETLGQEIEVNPVGESNILGISATAATPEEAAEIANEFARAALAVRARELRGLAEELTAQLEERLADTPAFDTETRSVLASRIDQVQSVAENGDPTLALSQQAIPPTSATGAPPALIVVLALFAGFALGAGAAVLLTLVNRHVRDEFEALALSPMPVLARVPELSPRNRRGPRNSRWYLPAEIREPFRTVALQLEQTGQTQRAVMVTSPTSGDGKTSSSINLAVSLAAAGKQVILLDFDLRNPQVSMALGIPGSRPSDLIDPEIELERLLVLPSDRMPNLRVLPIQSELAELEVNEDAAWRLPGLIEEARAMADYVIVDTPPLGTVSDALRLAPTVDDILVVIRPGSTHRTELRTLRELLERIGRRPDGCIVLGSGEAGAYPAYGYGGSSSELVLRAPVPVDGATEDGQPAASGAPEPELEPPPPVAEPEAEPGTGATEADPEELERRLSEAGPNA